MKKAFALSVMILFAASLFTASTFLMAKETQTKVGWITDTMCKGKGIEGKNMSCAVSCVKNHGAKFAFYDPESKETFEIENQEMAMKYAGKEVTIKGTFNVEKKMVYLEEINKVEKK